MIYDGTVETSLRPLYLLSAIVPLCFIALMLGFKPIGLCDCFLEISLLCT